MPGKLQSFWFRASGRSTSFNRRAWRNTIKCNSCFLQHGMALNLGSASLGVIEERMRIDFHSQKASNTFETTSLRPETNCGDLKAYSPFPSRLSTRLDVGTNSSDSSRPSCEGSLPKPETGLHWFT